jgi:hypothetical protein
LTHYQRWLELDEPREFRGLGTRKSDGVCHMDFGGGGGSQTLGACCGNLLRFGVRSLRRLFGLGGYCDVEEAADQHEERVRNVLQHVFTSREYRSFVFCPVAVGASSLRRISPRVSVIRGGARREAQPR